MNKKLIASMLSLAMLFAFASCSKEEAPETTATTATEGTTTEETSEATTETTTEVPEETEIVIPDFDINSVPTFVVTSENLHDDVWDTVITNTDAGENLSPELSWEEVDGASMYVIYMVDLSAGNWVHMKVSDITSTSLPAGELDSSTYIGPYPPSGTHDYVVYVFALRDNPVATKGLVDRRATSLEFLFSSLNVNEAGETGNVISVGILPGTFTAQ